jgi:hypothetical protein
MNKKTPEEKHSRNFLRARHHSAQPWLLAILSILIYLKALFNDFAYDDLIIILDNPTIRDLSLSQVKHIFSVSYWYPHLPLDNLYRPLVILTYAVEFALWGLQPFGYHLVNVLLHAVNVILVYRIVLVLPGGPDNRAFWIAALFASHPVMSEAVSNITCRADILTAFFILLAGYVLVSKYYSKSVLLRNLLITILIACALISKENGIVGIGIIALLDIYMLKKRHSFGRVVLKAITRNYSLYVFVIAGILAILVYRSLVLGHAYPTYVITPPELNLLPYEPTAHRVFTGIKLLGLYGLKLILPLRLSFEYGTSQIPINRSFSDLGVMLSFLFIVGFLALAVRYFSRDRTPSIALFWIFGSLLPMSNLVFPGTSIFNERFLYLSMFGFSVLMIWGLVKLSNLIRIGDTAIAIVVGVIVMGYSARTFVRTFDWKDQETIVGKSLRDSPKSSNAAFAYAQLMRDKGDMKSYRQSLELAIENYPDNAKANYNLAGIAKSEGRIDDAIDHYEAAVSDRPTQISLQASMKLGILYSNLNQLDSAITYYNKALSINPREAGAHYNLALIYRGKDRLKYEYHKKLAARMGKPLRIIE